MPRVKIKQLDERVATQGVHLGGGSNRRKLEPGEVLDIPEGVIEGGHNLFDTVWATGKLELTLDEVTRPLDYLNYREARLCSTKFKPRDANEKMEMHKVRAEVMARLKPTESEVPDKPESLSDDTLDIRPKRTKRAKPRVRPKAKAETIPSTNPRARRRAAARRATHGQENIT